MSCYLLHTQVWIFQPLPCPALPPTASSVDHLQQSLDSRLLKGKVEIFQEGAGWLAGAGWRGAGSECWKKDYLLPRPLEQIRSCLSSIFPSRTHTQIPTHTIIHARNLISLVWQGCHFRLPFKGFSFAFPHFPPPSGSWQLHPHTHSDTRTPQIGTIPVQLINLMGERGSRTIEFYSSTLIH